MESIVALNSGGLDSNVIVAYYRHKGYAVHSLFVDYGQNQVEQERKMAKLICREYSAVYHEAKIELPWLSSSTNLVGGEINDWDNCSNSVEDNLKLGLCIPMRNSILLSMAASLAESLSITTLATGLDGYQDIFGRPLNGIPDSHTRYIRKMTGALSEGSSMYHVNGNKFKILTPLMTNLKEDTIMLGVNSGADLSLSWSCFNNEDKPCLHCSACKMRERAFYNLGVEDPLLVKYNIPPLNMDDLILSIDYKNSIWYNISRHLERVCLNLINNIKRRK